MNIEKEQQSNADNYGICDVSADLNVASKVTNSYVASKQSTLAPVKMIVKSKEKLPVTLIKVESTVPLGEKVLMFVLKYAKAYGGYENAFGHRKKLKSFVPLFLHNCP